MKKFVEKLIERLAAEAHAFEIAIQNANQLTEEHSNVPDINVGKWIPCSERLPKETGCYFVTWRDRASCENYVEINEYDSNREEWLDCICQAGLLGYDIIAWMQLPEPYDYEKRKIEKDKKEFKTRIECIRSMNDEELAEKIFESEVSAMLDFCQEFSKCIELNEKGEEIPDEMCKKCLVKWLNSVEQQKKIPIEHFEERFNRVN